MTSVKMKGNAEADRHKEHIAKVARDEAAKRSKVQFLYVEKDFHSRGIDVSFEIDGNEAPLVVRIALRIAEELLRTGSDSEVRAILAAGLDQWTAE